MFRSQKFLLIFYSLWLNRNQPLHLLSLAVVPRKVALQSIPKKHSIKNEKIIHHKGALCFFRKIRQPCLEYFPIVGKLWPRWQFYHIVKNWILPRLAFVKEHQRSITLKRRALHCCFWSKDPFFWPIHTNFLLEFCQDTQNLDVSALATWWRPYRLFQQNFMTKKKGHIKIIWK